jgi:glycosyltransferase involved in cell wall biosynthesis
MTSPRQVGRRSPLHLLRLALWSVRNSPALARRAAGAVFSAEDAQARVILLEHALQDMRDQLMLAMSEQARLSAERFDNSIERVRAELAARLDDLRDHAGRLSAQTESFDVIIADLGSQATEIFTRLNGLHEHLSFVEKATLLQGRSPATSYGQDAAWSIEGPVASQDPRAAGNRELARALSRAGEAVALIASDSAVPCSGDAQLAAHPDLATMLARAATATPGVRLLDGYPPDAEDRRGECLVWVNFAWPENAIPDEFTVVANTSLNLITVANTRLAAVLRDNGVDVPIAVTGTGIDPEAIERASAARSANGEFRFGHVSMNLDRDGTDVLLEAWRETFTGADPVELIIAASADARADVERRMSEMPPSPAAVTLIDLDSCPAGARGFTLDVDAMLFPSRGETSGLPIADAMARDKPVIVTGFGGHREFCTDDTAWLCDFQFVSARSGQPHSVWVEADRPSLGRMMTEVFAAPAKERQRRAARGREFVLSHYTWDQVAARTQAAVATVRRNATRRFRLPKIGLISTWNSRCGIAAYAQSLARGIQAEQLTVFANKQVEVLRQDESFVRRCWVQGWLDPLDELEQQVMSTDLDAVVIQFNLGFYMLRALRHLLDRLRERGIPVFMILHATADVVREDVVLHLVDLQPALSRVCRLLVHSVHDLNRLKAVGAIDNTALFPMGLPDPPTGDREALRDAMGLRDRVVIGSFGYLLPHKGLPELLQAFALLRESVPNAHLLMLNALYPLPHSTLEHDAVLRQIIQLDLRQHVTMMTGFLNEREVIARLAATDLIVYPYQETQESASAAVKMGIASLTPIAVTPLPIFADVASVCHELPGIAPEDIARGIAALLADAPALDDLRARQRAWVSSHSWPALSRRLTNMISSELRARDKNYRAFAVPPGG